MSQIDLQWFAAGEEDKTEEASESKLRKAREEEGRVPKSQELNGAVVFLFTVLALVFMAPWILENIMKMMVFYFHRVTWQNVDSSIFSRTFWLYLIKLFLPIAFVGLVAGILMNVVQNKGWIFTTKSIEFKWSKIAPNFIEYFRKNFFSVMGVFNSFKSMLKVGIIGLLGWFFIRSDLKTTLGFFKSASLLQSCYQIGRMVAKLLIVSSLILIVISVFDYIMQYREFKKQMKMTKQEVKEEFKSYEGDPEVKSRLANAQREMLTQNMPKAVREADVLITNPTHFAVSLQWKRNEADVPQITAKGMDMTAQNMKRIAREADVPIIENRSLARGLYNDTEVGDFIPVAYFRVVSTVYAQISYMEKEKDKN